MSETEKIGTYILVSPVRDEAKYVERTLSSIAAQSLRPLRWVIIDDGSIDETPQILQRYADRFSWIRVVRGNPSSSRQPGAAVINAFNVGYDLVKGDEFEFIVKLDCDLDLPTYYFESLSERFAADPHLGIASGIYVEDGPQGWQSIDQPLYHAAGAAKMIRRECFRQIGGFVVSRGWDTVDEIKAQVLGWRTCHFDDLSFRHLKKEGSAIGALPTAVMHGEVYYLTGGGVLFFILKILDRIVSRPLFLIGGMALLWGYMRSIIRRQTRLVTSIEAKHYSRTLNRRIWESLMARLRIVPATRPAWRSR
jgi:biofilm PGA synthesis N-glycosyltransferase PgaC